MKTKITQFPGGFLLNSFCLQSEKILLDKEKKHRLKFNPVSALITLRTTGPSLFCIPLVLEFVFMSSTTLALACYLRDYTTHQRLLWNYHIYTTTLQCTCCMQTYNQSEHRQGKYRRSNAATDRPLTAVKTAEILELTVNRPLVQL